MKVIRSKEEEIINACLDMMDRLRTMPALSIECDKETGIQIVGRNGAIGASPDMPRDLTAQYLTHELGSLLDDA